MKFKKTEKIEAFLQRFITMSDAAFPGLHRADRDAILVPLFIRALPTEMRTRVFRANPVTLSSAVSLAQRIQLCEDFEQHEGERAMAKNRNAGGLQAVQEVFKYLNTAEKLGKVNAIAPVAQTNDQMTAVSKRLDTMEAEVFSPPAPRFW